jgi:hypothetical protein
VLQRLERMGAAAAAMTAIDARQQPQATAADMGAMLDSPMGRGAAAEEMGKWARSEMPF